MAYLTVKGEDYFLSTLVGEHSAGTTGYDRCAIYGSVSGGADAIIDVVKTITWAHPTGVANLTGTLPLFTIATNTVIKGVILLNSTVGVTLADALSKYEFSEYYSYSGAGTFKIDSLSYNFEHI
jgi:hypothetical protein